MTGREANGARPDRPNRARALFIMGCGAPDQRPADQGIGRNSGAPIKSDADHESLAASIAKEVAGHGVGQQSDCPPEILESLQRMLEDLT